MEIGILGPEGTFSETAAMLWLKEGGRIENFAIKYYETIFDVSESIVKKEVNYGIVPIENSLEGSVGDTLDVLSSENADEMQIVGEVLVPIRICLLFNGSFPEIKKIVSHHHALAQCKQFIRERLKGVALKSVDSTASAAKLAAQSEQIAALASAESAKMYGVNILAEDVQDKDSITRFVVLSSSGIKAAPTGKDKTSILLSVKERPGALYEVLGEFALRGLNLTKIESRPSKRALGDYMFYIDCEGHLEEAEMQEALKGVEKKAAMLKILGTYPMAIRK
uniref:prephenate dehydratase n=2 Tax=Methanomicrobia TaxID=224756 RepID=A0A7H1KPB4_9EURY|nr:prephenate dehydratase [Methanosarcinales archaeon ANME-1 ERB7]QNT35778.1 prephenate dehydratase [uncultured Methanosarcinales archaeon]